MIPVAIIGGSGLERLPDGWSMERAAVSTVFGPAVVTRAAAAGQEVIFLSRHGESHGIAPHEINYNANIAALAQSGVRRVLATNAVGSLRIDLPVGSLVVYDDFLDFTRSRPVSYWVGHPAPPEGMAHTDFSQPYCPMLRGALIEAAAELDIPLLPRSTYVCADGPRFESPAEVRMYAHLGGDVVGMTGLPEAIFAREAGLCYAGVGIVTNIAAGLSAGRVDHDDVMRGMKRQVEIVRRLLMRAASLAAGTACEFCR